MDQRVKYQIFISSTYRDLHEARREVSWTVLGLDHIPAGMEAFPATDDRGWGIIKRTIQDSDFYILLIAGLYGSIDQETGLSWTEKEYDFAKSLNLPVLAFVQRRSATPGDMVEANAKQKKLLNRFISRIRESHYYKEWSEDKELSGLVSLALTREIQIANESRFRPRGWTRGPDAAAAYTRTLALAQDRKSILIEPLTIDGHQALAVTHSFARLRDHDYATLTVEMPSVPYGRITMGSDGVPQHELRGHTPPATTAQIPWTAVTSARPDDSLPHLFHLHLRQPLTFRSSSRVWEII
ncbi:DUF4062 domain-containing protein [Nannocystis pusilla]|uniref:DUF4062 domain-containing protein n=1 Tax=Nannocystis pusilla TaxID=889268 RepID=A0ABS7U1D5_9BACT|nr:DUF4062 domain-containing protein [Nannocystis pusilla]MBZ5714249.1 DUF4062 domain-containing protein [Nannocystis pusilla]